MLELFGRAVELTGGTLRLELHDVLANDEHAVALFISRAERAGRRLEDHTVQVTHLGDGKVTEIWLHPGDAYAGDEFWS